MKTFLRSLLLWWVVFTFVFLWSARRHNSQPAPVVPNKVELRAA